jgi:hypothetical protein
LAIAFVSPTKHYGRSQQAAPGELRLYRLRLVSSNAMARSESAISRLKLASEFDNLSAASDRKSACPQNCMPESSDSRLHWSCGQGHDPLTGPISHISWGTTIRCTWCTTLPGCPATVRRQLPASWICLCSPSCYLPEIDRRVECAHARGRREGRRRRSARLAATWVSRPGAPEVPDDRYAFRSQDGTLSTQAVTATASEHCAREIR